MRTVEGRQTYYQANPNCPVFDELRGLVRKTSGLVSLLRAGLASIAGRIQVAFVYGSFAADHERAGSDVDVLVAGSGLSLRGTVNALREAEREVRREVNPSVLS
jgi:predicted nucleotidyltransferase